MRRLDELHLDHPFKAYDMTPCPRRAPRSITLAMVPVVINRLTGEVRMVQIFVAVLGASSSNFAKANWTQTLPDWIDTYVSAPLTIGGVRQLIAPVEAAVLIVERWLLCRLRRRTFCLAEVNAAIGEMLKDLNEGTDLSADSASPAANCS